MEWKFGFRWKVMSYVRLGLGLVGVGFLVFVLFMMMWIEIGCKGAGRRGGEKFKLI